MTNRKVTVSVVSADAEAGWVLVKYEDSELSWPIQVRVARRAGRFVVIGVELEAGLDAETWRQIPIGRIDTALNCSPVALAAVGAPGQAGSSMLRPKMKIRIPPAGQRGDGFYRSVAELYRWCAGNGVPNPAERIATANDVPATRVHGWIRDARRRGMLPPARKGKIG